MHVEFKSISSLSFKNAETVTAPIKSISLRCREEVIKYHEGDSSVISRHYAYVMGSWCSKSKSCATDSNEEFFISKEEYVKLQKVLLEYGVEEKEIAPKIAPREIKSNMDGFEI